MSTGIISSWKDKIPQHSYQTLFLPADLFYPNSTAVFCIIIPTTYLSQAWEKKIKLQMYIPDHKKTKKVLASKFKDLVLHKFLEHFTILYLKFSCCIFKINVCTENRARDAKLWLHIKNFLHPETFPVTIKKSCRKSMPDRKHTLFFTDYKKGGEKLPNF